MDVRELAWASGLFDGEGCISVHHNRGTRMVYPQMDLAMQDEDSVRRFHRAVGGIGTLTVRPPHGTNRRPLFVWRANSVEVTQAVIALLWYGLSGRRKARATEIMAAVRDSQVHRKTMRRGESCSVIPCSSAVWARGFCNKHYAASRYDGRKDVLNARRREKHAIP